MKKPIDVIEHLAAFVAQHNLVARALEGCTKYLTHSLNEDPILESKLSVHKVQRNFRSHSLVFEHSLLSYPYLATRIDLFFEGEEIGWYKLIVDLEGQIIDDYIEIYPEYGDETL